MSQNTTKQDTRSEASTRTSTTGYRGERTATRISVTGSRPHGKANAAMFAVRSHYKKQKQLNPVDDAPEFEERKGETHEEESFQYGEFEVVVKMRGEERPVSDQFDAIVAEVKDVFPEAEA